MASDPNGPSLAPELGYRDPRQAIQWLTEVLGLQRGLIVDGPAGSVAHAELWWHAGVVFVESKPPDDDGPTRGATVCLTAESSADVDRIYDRAVVSGAEIMFDLADTPFGSHQFEVRDPEGHVWTIGTYRPAGPSS